MQKKQAPIGIYDSGVGGLTVWLALRQLINEDLIYYGDTAHVPYGDKSRDQILLYSHNIIHFLEEKKVLAVVAACNTSSALALPVVRVSSGMPIFGVIEPAVEKAIASTRNNRVGIIATVGTVNSGSYQRSFQQFAPSTEVFAQGCPKLVPLIERGEVEGLLVNQALHEYLDSLIDWGMDTLVLGCTHYPFLLPAIKRIVGEHISIVDPAWQTAKNVYDWLQGLPNVEEHEVPSYQFWVSGSPEEFQKRASQFLGFTLAQVGGHNQVELEPRELRDFLGQLWPAWRGDQDDSMEK